MPQCPARGTTLLTLKAATVVHGASVWGVAVWLTEHTWLTHVRVAGCRVNVPKVALNQCQKRPRWRQTQPPTSLQGYLSHVLDFLSECPSGIKVLLSTVVTGLWGSLPLVSFPPHLKSHPAPCFLLSSRHKGAAFSFSSQTHLPGKPKAIARVSHITVCALSYQAEDGEFIIVIIIVIIIITISSERGTHAK